MGKNDKFKKKRMKMNGADEKKVSGGNGPQEGGSFNGPPQGGPPFGGNFRPDSHPPCPNCGFNGPQGGPPGPPPPFPPPPPRDGRGKPPNNTPGNGNPPGGTPNQN